MPKYVVSSTIEDARWTTSTNSTVLKGDVVDEVSRLKREIDGEIVVFASTQLVHTLIEHDLVDQLRLMVYPVVAGAGKRLFEDVRDSKQLHLVQTRTVGDNLASLTYDLDGAAY
jgi:dihydrofolate reductase